jgi:hypothetical protein
MGIYYQVQQGDCLCSIAEKWGFPNYEAIYLDSGNTAFREKRPNPNIIFPGDVLFIPDRKTKEFLRPTDQQHRFVAKRAKVYLRLCLQDDLHQPHKNTKYQLRVGGNYYRGSSDGDGIMEQRIPADASEGEITIFPMESDPSDAGYTFALNLGHLDPIDETSGIDARLVNLGFAPPHYDSHGLSDEERVEVLKSFQERFGLDVTGEADQTTRQKLSQVHDAA